MIDKIRKHKHLIHKSKYDGLLDDMRSLHNSSSKTIYKENINSFTDKYLNNHYDMYEYIRDQWLEGAVRLNVDTCYNECSCTCSLFSKNAVCMHLIAFSNLFCKGLFGEQWYNVPTQFNHAPKRGRKTKKTCYGTISKRR